MPVPVIAPVTGSIVTISFPFTSILGVVGVTGVVAGEIAGISIFIDVFLPVA